MRFFNICYLERIVQKLIRNNVSNKQFQDYSSVVNLVNFRGMFFVWMVMQFGGCEEGGGVGYQWYRVFC